MLLPFKYRFKCHLNLYLTEEGLRVRKIALEEAFWVDTLQTPWMLDPRTAPASFFAETVRQDAARRVVERIRDVGDLRITEMDAHGIDVQVLSLGTPGLEYQPDTKVAVDDAKRANDFLVQAIAAHPGRFAGFATLPLQDPDAAVRELARAVEELGLVGALVSGPSLGHYLDEPQFEPVWAALEDLGVPLYLHPNFAAPDDQWAVLQGYPELTTAMHRWGADTGAHALRIVLGGVFEQHPSVKLILGHMGEFLPFQLTRFDSIYSKTTNPRRLTQPPSDYIRQNIYITTSGVFSPVVLAAAAEEIGIEHVMFAIDYPYESTSDAVKILDAPLTPADIAKIAHLNAEKLLNIPRPTETGPTVRG